MSDTNLPAVQLDAQADLEGFLKDELTKSGLGMIQANGKKNYGINISAKEYLVGLAQFLNGPKVKEVDSGKVSQTTKWQNKVSKYVIKQYDIIFTKQAERLWIRPMVPEIPSDYTYTPLYGDELIRLIVETFEDVFHRETTAQEARATADTLKTQVLKERKVIDFVDNNVIQITDNLFWDGNVGTVNNIKEAMDVRKENEDLDLPPVEITCFRRLFDTDRHSPQAVKWDDDGIYYWNSSVNEKNILEVYHQTLIHFESSNGKLPIPVDPDNKSDPNTRIYFHFIMQWADYDVDTYHDILNAIAACFLKVKPKASYFLIGPSRNGKSTMNDLLRTIFGGNNTESLPMTALADWHYAKHLNNAIANLPDEDIVLEGDKKAVAETIAAYKIASTHGQRKMARMAKEDPVVIYDDYMNFFPMNHMPNWGNGAGAEACVRRCWPIYFTHDFSKEDTRVERFTETTFTPRTLSRLLGVVLALANYYTHHELTMSPTMELHRGQVEENTSSSQSYREAFLQRFNGFENKRLLYNDYKLYCQDNDLKFAPRSEFFTFIDTMLKPEKYRVDSKGRKKPVWPKIYIPGLGKKECFVLKTWDRDHSNVLHSHSIIKEVGRIVEGKPGTSEAAASIHGEYDNQHDIFLGRSVLTAIAEANAVRESKVAQDPSQIPPEKPKSSEQFVKEYNQKGEQ